jgi:hypothetical protein
MLRLGALSSDGELGSGEKQGAEILIADCARFSTKASRRSGERSNHGQTSSAGTHALSGRGCGRSLWCSLDVSARRWRHRRNLRNHVREESIHRLSDRPLKQAVPQTSSATAQKTRFSSGLITRRIATVATEAITAFQPPSITLAAMLQPASARYSSGVNG